MATTLPGVDIPQARDLVGRGWQIWVRRVLLMLLCLLPVLALLDVFGQQEGVQTARGDGVTVQLLAPATLRGGLLYEARFTVIAHRDLKQATLELGAGWARGMTINALSPSPSNETSDGNRIALQLGGLSAGEEYVLHIDFQVNPTTVGHRHQTVAVFDGQDRLATLDHELMVWP